ncbi:MAG: class I SAM-dependent methyltransferase [Candidatus Eisenbacteria bacterium]|uniref:Class I SAM-dependent methyltransferase n=1 Tax=Eiseniibacteriota bacterium TaxID=2212470 RepID=A0A849SIM2_UNCEI|nr:class I SAM-dependent methyltransferase [Candidatus Eisenbacteria bacterium]
MSFQWEAKFFCALLPAARPPRRVLVVGCGDGTEAAHIASETGATVVGLDLDVDASRRRPGVHLLRADARRLPFRDATFDALYCYHVLEHVPSPERAVAEARRALGAGSVAFFGTPNRLRMVGYVGGRATTLEKLQWNLADWGKRLTGRWSNAQGAHAGFSGGELSRMLATPFGSVSDVSVPYYCAKYPRLQPFWRWAFRFGVGRFLAPSVYFLADDSATRSVSG